LEHGPLFVAAPIGARDLHEPHGLGIDLPGVFDVRAAAKVRELIVAVGGNDGGLAERVAVLVFPALLQPGDQLQLVGLVRKETLGFPRVDFAAHKGIVPADDLAHALLDGLEILRG